VKGGGGGNKRGEKGKKKLWGGREQSGKLGVFVSNFERRVKN